MSTRRNALGYALQLLLLLGVLIALYQFTRYYDPDSLRVRLGFEDLLFVGIGSLFLGLFAAALWSACLQPFTHQRSLLPLAIINVSVLLAGKYLPGKVWGIAGRLALNKRYQIPASSVLAGSYYEIYVTTAYAIVTGGAMYALTVLQPVGTDWRYPTVLGMLVIAVALLLMFRNPLLGLNSLAWARKKLPEALQSSMPFKTAAGIFLRLSCYWIAFSAVFFTFVDVAGNHLSTVEGLILLGAYMLGVSGGFLAVFAPGGIGVREGLFAVLGSTVLSPADVVEIALLLRLWTFAFELVYAAVGFLLYQWLNRQDA